jgi:integrase
MRAQEGAEGFGLVLEALAGTGLRLRALLSLKPTHLRLNGHKPHILVDAGSMACKGAYAGIVPITPYVAKLLSGQTQSPIFQCSASYVQKKLPALGAQHGIPQLHAHALRHLYCAMIYYKDFDGGRFNPVAVRDAAGHASIAVTDRYLKLARTLVSSDSEWNLWANGGTKP